MTMISNYDDLLLDFDYLAEDTIVLEPDSMQQAAELSSQMLGSSRQWQTYLNALALYAFEQWLKERTPELPIDRENCSLMQPAVANAIAEGVCNLQVGDFKLCLLPIGSSIENILVLPRAVIELSEYVAHFYVAIAVQEELEQARIKGFIAYDRLMAELQSANLAPETDWTYQLPIAWFESDCDRLLLYLGCLETSVISLPAIPNYRANTAKQLEEEMISVIPQLQSGDYYLWQLFNWQQAELLLTNSKLLKWLYRLQTEPELLTEREQTSLAEQLSQILNNLSQQVVNVASWLDSELDEIAQNIAWNLLPALALATVPLRSMRLTAPEYASDEFAAIIAELQGTELEVPPEARGAYLEFNLANNPFRLYAITWLSSTEEWTLVLVLGLQTGQELPPGLKLQVSDRDNILFEKLVETDSKYVYLYASTIGDLAEEFFAQISFNNSEEVTFNFLFEL